MAGFTTKKHKKQQNGYCILLKLGGIWKTLSLTSSAMFESSITTLPPSADLVSDLIGMCNTSSTQIKVSLTLTFPAVELLTTIRYLVVLRPPVDSGPIF